MSYKCVLGVGGRGSGRDDAASPSTTLQDLINNGTPMVAGDKIFSDFTTGGTLPASAITVNFLPSSGLQFTANWNTLTPGSNSAVIGYTVSVSPTSGNTMSATCSLAARSS